MMRWLVERCAAAAGRRRRAGVGPHRRRFPGGAGHAARRLPRVRAAAGRDPDRGARPVHRRGREPRHACRSRTRSTACPASKTMRSKSVLGLSSVVLIFEQGTDLMGARQLVQERLPRVVAQLPAVGPAAGDPVAAVVAQPGAEDRHLVQDAVADGDDDAGAVDDPAAADGRARRRQRRHLGPARPAVPGAGRSRPAAQPTASRWPTS